MRKWLLPAKLALAAGLMALTFAVVDWRASVERLADASPGWTLAALVLTSLAIPVSALRWRLLLDVLAPGLRFAAALRYTWIGAFFSTVLPSTVGGDVARLALARHAGGLAPVAASMVVDRALGLAVLLLLGVASVLASPSLVLGAEVPASAPPLALACLAAVALGLAAGRRTLAAGLGRLPFASSALVRKAAGKVGELATALATYRHSPRALLTGAALSLALNLVIVLFQFATIRAVGGEIPLAAVLVVAPAVTLIAGLPLSVNGIGVSEAAFVVLYGQAGLPAEVALAAALLRRVLITLAAMVGAPLWLAERGGPGRAEAGPQHPGIVKGTG